MYTEILQQLGLAKNEARIYEMLLQEGESSVGRIALKSQVHRRNVYDSLHRLIEKGLVFEMIQMNENRYKAVAPQKLMELLQEKQRVLENIMPNLDTLYKGTPHKEEVYIYRGPEGWKNYMMDMLRLSTDAYFIGAKGGWLDQRMKYFFPQFIKEAKKRKIAFYHLFDYEVKEQFPQILRYVGKHYKFLPRGYSTKAAIDIFGDHVNIISGIKLGGLVEEFSITVIVNPFIADAFRVWFQFMWDMCPDAKKYGITPK
jgi:sugar-specific transcriptional regulator TrmB